MESILATVNLNIGLGSKNPVLTIRANDNLSTLIDELVEEYKLPQKVHGIIMEKVKK
jgi:hypothetical protein